MGLFLKEENIYFISLKHETSRTALKTAPMINYFILFELISYFCKNKTRKKIYRKEVFLLSLGIVEMKVVMALHI